MVSDLKPALLTVPWIMLASVSAFASAPPDGIYDLVVGGDKQGVTVVEGGKFTRPVQAGKCVLTEATGVIIGETLTIPVPDDCLGKTLLDYRRNKGILQFRDSASWYVNTSASTTDGYSPSLSLSSGLFLDEHYLYSDAYLDTRSGKYNRGDSHISRDIPSLHSRVTVGDHPVETSSALVYGDRVAGLLFARNWQQDPDRAATVYYSSSHRLKLTSRSTVEIFRDGQLVDRSELSAGDYDTRIGLSKWMDMMLAKAGITKKGRACHALRHTCGALLYQATRDVKVVQETLRHASIAMAAKYSHVQERGKARYTQQIPVRP